MKQKKIIFIDIDGTLRNRNRELTQRTKDAITQALQREWMIVLCSGRPRKYTEDISRQCNASNYIITSSGGNIYDYHKNQILYTNIMDKEACIKLYDLANKKDVRFIMNVDDGRVVNKLKHMDGTEILLKTDIRSFVYTHDIVQCTVADSNFEKIKSMEEAIKKIEKVNIRNQHKSLIDDSFQPEGTIYYDISNTDCSKGKAIIELCKILQVNRENTIAIGDDKNDLSMFEVVGYRVAVENAIKELKTIADEITKSNDEDGVAIFLEKLLKEGT